MTEANDLLLDTLVDQATTEVAMLTIPQLVPSHEAIGKGGDVLLGLGLLVLTHDRGEAELLSLLVQVCVVFRHRLSVSLDIGEGLAHVRQLVEAQRREACRTLRGQGVDDPHPVSRSA